MVWNQAKENKKTKNMQPVEKDHCQKSCQPLQKKYDKYPNVEYRLKRKGMHFLQRNVELVRDVS